MILQASNSRKESCVRFLADARRDVELLTPTTCCHSERSEESKKSVSILTCSLQI